MAVPLAKLEPRACYVLHSFVGSIRQVVWLPEAVGQLPRVKLFLEQQVGLFCIQQTFASPSVTLDMFKHKST